MGQSLFKGKSDIDFPMQCVIMMLEGKGGGRGYH